MSEDINKLKISMQGIKKDIDYIKTSLDENKTDCKEMIMEIKEWIKVSDKKFANKWTERVLVWLGIGIGGAMIVKFMSLIIK